MCGAVLLYSRFACGAVEQIKRDHFARQESVSIRHQAIRLLLSRVHSFPIDVSFLDDFIKLLHCGHFTEERDRWEIGAQKTLDASLSATVVVPGRCGRCVLLLCVQRDDERSVGIIAYLVGLFVVIYHPETFASHPEPELGVGVGLLAPYKLTYPCVFLPRYGFRARVLSVMRLYPSFEEVNVRSGITEVVIGFRVDWFHFRDVISHADGRFAGPPFFAIFG